MKTKELLNSFFENFFPYKGEEDLLKKLDGIKFRTKKINGIKVISIENSFPFLKTCFILKKEEMIIFIEEHRFIVSNFLISKNGVFIFQNWYYDYCMSYLSDSFEEFKKNKSIEALKILPNWIKNNPKVFSTEKNSHYKNHYEDFKSSVFINCKKDDFYNVLKEKEDADLYLEYLKHFFKYLNIKIVNQEIFVKKILEPFININEELILKFKEELNIEWDITFDQYEIVVDEDTEIPF